jgi:RNA polymerase sigma factor (sigma-70 family)
MPLSDRDLIDGFLRGDKPAHQTIREWVDIVIRSAPLNSSVSYEDVEADVIEKLLGNFRGGRFRFESSLKTYVQKVTKFTIIDAGRRCRRLQTDLEDVMDEVADPDQFIELFERKEEYAIYLRVYDLIGEDCRRLWKMLFQEELPSAEIAKRIGITLGTLKTRTFRCKEKAIELVKKIL